MANILAKRLFVIFISAALASCSDGGGNGASGSSDNTADTNDFSPLPNDPENIQRGAGQGISAAGKLILEDANNGIFAELSISEFSLPNNLSNARENTTTPRYIGRTAQRSSGDEAVKVPIRSYVAHCTDSSGVDNMFVSQSLQEGSSASDRVGSVYQLKYDSSIESYAPTNNSVILSGVCNETHGVAVSDDCSRVAVLCEADYNYSEVSTFLTKDIAAASGVAAFNQGDNGAFVNNWTDISEMMNYAFDDPIWPDLFDSIGMPPISAVLIDLQQAYPDAGFNAETTYRSLDNNSDLLQVVEDSAAVQSNVNQITNGLQQFHFKPRDEMWLLEWNNEDLSAQFDGYLVTKNAGESKSSMNLIYVENDSLGRTSYAFTAPTHEYKGAKNEHTAAAMFVIDRDTWHIKVSASQAGVGRGWSWDCVHGHDLLTRTFYNPYAEMYASVCTSDTTYSGDPKSPIGGGHLGTIGIKTEAQSHLSSGKTSYYVPTHGSPVVNGGGHTAVAISAQDTMIALAAPQLFTPSTKAKYMVTIDNYVQAQGLENKYAGLSDDEKCWQYHTSDIEGGCDISMYYSIVEYEEPLDMYVNSTLWIKEQVLDPRFYTRVGVRVLDTVARGVPDKGTVSPVHYKAGKGRKMKWIAGLDWDIDVDGEVVINGKKVGDGSNDTEIACTYGDPQLVDLKNGRFLMGYAKYLCSDYAFTKGRMNQDAYYDRFGGIAMMFPRAYYLVEIDAAGNILEGPVELSHDTLGDIGWGAIDEMIPLGDGKVGWVYMPDPTIENVAAPIAPSPLSKTWQVMVYESKHTGN